jgi:MFS superfamily sulfate permease-like transporter
LQKLDQIHLPTLAVGALAFAVLLLSMRLVKNLPAALVAMIVAAVAVFFLGLQAQGVATLGLVPAGLPAIGLPARAAELFATHHEALLLSAAGIALISFTSTMLTSRSFAAKNRYDVDADRDFAALGAANIAAALSQGFAIAGADSRTAMSDSSGGRTRLAGLFAAIAIGLVLLFLTAPLQYVPVAALGAVLVMAGLSLINLQALRHFWSMDRREFMLSLIATLGVIWVGALNAVLFVVLLALLRFVQFSARPKVEQLGRVPGMPGLHSLGRHSAAVAEPGLVLFRFNGPLVFFNASYFKREALAAANQQGDRLRWFVLDMLPLTQVDLTGLDALAEVQAELASRGVELVAAGRRSEIEQSKKQLPLPGQLFPTMRKALQAYRSRHGVAGSDDVAD